MEEEIVIILVPKKSVQRAAEDGPGYTLHTVGGELTKQEQRMILRALLKDLRDE